jgi:hypothetical protein
VQPRHPRTGRTNRNRQAKPAKSEKPPKLSRRERKEAAKFQSRRVRRVIRHVDPWSVLKVSLLFYVCLFLILLSAGIVLWVAASAAGAVDNVEKFIKDLFLFESFAFEPGQILRACAVGGLVLVMAGTALNVLLAVLFNLISDIVGGVRVSVIEQEPVRRPFG